MASARSRTAAGLGTVLCLTFSMRLVPFEVAWCWLLQVDFQEYRRERARGVWKHIS